MTGSYAILDVSKATYDEVARKLRAAGYDECFRGIGAGQHVVMDGLALQGVDGVLLDVSDQERRAKRAERGHIAVEMLAALITPVAGYVARDPASAVEHALEYADALIAELDR